MQRVAHVTLILQNVPGVVNKLDSQAQVCKENNIPIDFFWLSGDWVNKETKQYLNFVFCQGNNAVELRLSQMKKLNRIGVKYDKVILRYPLFDPFILFLYKHKFKTILEHHAFELEELRLIGSKRLFLEKVFAPFFIRKFSAITAVTQEIVDYEFKRAGFKGKSHLQPNAINVVDKALHGNIRGSQQIEIAFVCSYFYDWHGLDILIQATETQVCDDFKIHLVGEIPEKYEKSLSDKNCFVKHGLLSSDKVEEIIHSCDLGLSCLALERKGLKEASALKVREYLANGLPVAMTYREGAFPNDFPYLLEMEDFSFDSLREFITNIAGTAKLTIREKSRPYIDAKEVNQTLYKFCIN